MALCACLAQELQNANSRYSYRFLFVPGTIGSIAWLALNETQTARVKHGLVVACVGDAGRMTYKRSRQGNAEIDRAVTHVLRCHGCEYDVMDFSPYGYDERQYCSPGFNLPVGSLTRTPHGRYPEYHTSADNLNFVSPESLADSYAVYREVFRTLEHNYRYRNTHPKGEPQLGRRGLYESVGGRKELKLSESALLWTLNLSDGAWSLLDIAERAGLKFEQVQHAAETLECHGLLERI
jgi:aminopeptidase-like protein